MSDSNSTVPTTEFSVNITDPWTIAAISLLSILVTAASYRIYYVACKYKSKIGNNTVEVSRVKVQPKKTNFQSRAQMRVSQ
jgi:hypothetical protein